MEVELDDIKRRMRVLEENGRKRIVKMDEVKRTHVEIKRKLEENDRKIDELGRDSNERMTTLEASLALLSSKMAILLGNNTRIQKTRTRR